MKIIGPDYYPRFQCIAEKCSHSCCRGWEIDIDEDSFARYLQTEGAIGEKLQQCIVPSTDDALPHFRLTEDEKCPFLTEKGLCQLILEIGEDSLCQICRDHPRFRNYLTDRDEIGVGMCCEAAAALILNNKEKPRLILLSDDGGEEELTREEEALLSLRDAGIGILQDRDLSLNERLEKLLRVCGDPLPYRPMTEWAAFFLTLERLDDAWAEALNRAVSGDDRPDTPLGAEWDIPLEQFSVYLLYRHLPGALRDGDAEGRVAFTVLSVRLIQCLLQAREKAAGKADMEDLTALCRMFSAEIEYSDVNEDAILDEIANLRQEE